MKCPACSNYFDQTQQNVVCPHARIDRPDNPVGGPRVPQDQRALIDEAYHAQDQIALYRFMASSNPAVRIYAAQMCAALDEVNTLLQTQE
jgi:hypothetical protein